MAEHRRVRSYLEQITNANGFDLVMAFVALIAVIGLGASGWYAADYFFGSN